MPRWRLRLEHWDWASWRREGDQTQLDVQRRLPAIAVVTLSNVGDSRQAVSVRALSNPSALRLRALRGVKRDRRGVNHREQVDGVTRGGSLGPSRP